MQNPRIIHRKKLHWKKEDARVNPCVQWPQEWESWPTEIYSY